MRISSFFAVGVVLVGAVGAVPVMADQLFNKDTPMAMVTTGNSCIGQNIAFQGTMHTLWNITINNNSLHFEVHVNAQGVHGVGLTDGATYVLVNAENINTKISGALPVDLHWNTDIGLIGQGQSPNSRLRISTHTTIDAAGNVSVEFDKGSVVCQ